MFRFKPALAAASLAFTLPWATAQQAPENPEPPATPAQPVLAEACADGQFATEEGERACLHAVYGETLAVVGDFVKKLDASNLTEETMGDNDDKLEIFHGFRRACIEYLFYTVNDGNPLRFGPRPAYEQPRYCPLLAEKMGRKYDLKLDFDRIALLRTTVRDIRERIYGLDPRP